MKVQRVVMTVLVLGLLVACTSAAHALEGAFSIGPLGKTEGKPQSKLWFNDGAWWAILPGYDANPNTNGIYFYKQEGNVLRRRDQPGEEGRIDSRYQARADVLWDGTHLFVLLLRGSRPAKFYKYSYSSGTYTLVSGFPVNGLDLPFADTTAESATLAKEVGSSTDTLWVVYDRKIPQENPSSAEIRVLWSNPPHTTWSSANEQILKDAIDPDDLAAIVAFDNKIGVLWSNQYDANFGFRVHVNGQPQTTWRPEEVLPEGPPQANPIADDHLNFAVTDAHDLLVATKASVPKHNQINLFVRWHATGLWNGPYFISDAASRPIVLYDNAHQRVYVFYTDVTGGIEAGRIFYKTAPLSDLTALESGVSTAFMTGAGKNFDHVTSIKQAVDTTTGILVAAKETTEDKAHYKWLDLTPQVTHVETQTGGSTSSNTVTTGANLTGVSGHLYLAAIATKPQVAVSTVSGLGLTWTAVHTQCAGRKQTGVAVWWALGDAQTSDGSVTATLASTPANAVIAVSRYSGVDPIDPIGTVASHNTNGANGACSGGRDSNSYNFSLDPPTVVDGSVAYGAVAIRQRHHAPGPNVTERTEVHQGSVDGSMAGLAVEETPIMADPTTVDGTFSGSVDWAVIVIEILPPQ